MVKKNSITVKNEDIIKLSNIYKKDIDINWLENQENADIHTKLSSGLGYTPVDQNKLLKKLFYLLHSQE